MADLMDSTLCTYTLPNDSEESLMTFLTFSMAGRAKSNLEKHLAAKRLHDAWMAQAVAAYRLEQGRKLLKLRPRRGLHRICIELQETCFVETGNHVKLSHMMLKRLVGGGKTHQQANADRRWLGDGEEDIVIAFITEMAD